MRLIGTSNPIKVNECMSNLSYIHIFANKWNTVLYVGVTSNLKKRVWEHKQKLVEGFTKRYNIEKLVYYEYFESIELAIQREKQLKAGSRQKKLDLILKVNPEFKDLYSELE